ncbi:hypothetical protein HXX76_012509 [Chlamydomonas incerta]|uniref:Uncharacterized protein n=1 Tax=Chlamydomonas incerta TaxID=51695 RepID=A0A835SHX5_CHLIN|nr:hypothetical protein HXX76_012509 [Chlamydomonas incerta]|eukprot:KAG2427314.1 hypothetical protein HXX76_012509 [Chlamydomonas incerta]
MPLPVAAPSDLAAVRVTKKPLVTTDLMNEVHPHLGTGLIDKGGCYTSGNLNNKDISKLRLPMLRQLTDHVTRALQDLEPGAGLVNHFVKEYGPGQGMGLHNDTYGRGWIGVHVRANSRCKESEIAFWHPGCPNDYFIFMVPSGHAWVADGRLTGQVQVEVNGKWGCWLHGVPAAGNRRGSPGPEAGEWTMTCVMDMHLPNTGVVEEMAPSVSAIELADHLDSFDSTLPQRGQLQVPPPPQVTTPWSYSKICSIRGSIGVGSAGRGDFAARLVREGIDTSNPTVVARAKGGSAGGGAFAATMVARNLDTTNPTVVARAEGGSAGGGAFAATMVARNLDTTDPAAVYRAKGGSAGGGAFAATMVARNLDTTDPAAVYRAKGENRMTEDGYDDAGKSNAAVAMGENSMAKDGYDDAGKSNAAVAMGEARAAKAGQPSYAEWMPVIHDWLKENWPEEKTYGKWPAVAAGVPLPEDAHLGSIQKAYRRWIAQKEEKDKKERPSYAEWMPVIHDWLKENWPDEKKPGKWKAVMAALPQLKDANEDSLRHVYSRWKRQQEKKEEEEKKEEKEEKDEED